MRENEIICMYCKRLYDKQTKTYMDFPGEVPFGYSHGICPAIPCVTQLCLENTSTEAEFNSMLEEICSDIDGEKK